jgi:hypothetical protein
LVAFKSISLANLKKKKKTAISKHGVDKISGG